MDKLVESVVERIVAAIRPAKVILFGSRARGDAGPESDIDLLLVYDGALPKREVQTIVHRLFPLLDFSMDVFVLTSREYAMQQNVTATVGRAAAREGVVCHG